MRKELIWAAGIGITFGLIIAFGAWRINSSLNKQTSVTASPTPASTTSEFKVALNTPEQDDVITENTVTVSGITKALAWIAVSGEKGDYVLQAASDGTFSQDVDLTSGVNQIKVTAFDPAGNQSVQKVVVVYSASFQPAAVPTSTPTDNSTESAIRQKVEQKVAAALNKPKAYIGVVTDIADSTIEIKTSDGQIEQISTSDDNLTVVNIKGTNNKTVKLTDIAIGDFVVGMGYVNTQSVLLAQRILIADPIEESKNDAFYGKIATTTKKTVDVTTVADGKTQTLSPDKNTDIEVFANGKFSSGKISAFSENDLVIFVLDDSGTPSLVRSIFLIQPTQS